MSGLAAFKTPNVARYTAVSPAFVILQTSAPINNKYTLHVRPHISLKQQEWQWNFIILNVSIKFCDNKVRTFQVSEQKHGVFEKKKQLNKL